MKKGIFLILLVLASFLFTSCDTNINENITLTNEEAGYIINFLTDFLVFSKEGKLDIEDRGFPKQFYIYDKNMTISLGKMLFLFFQKQTYEAMNVSKPYFIPKEKSFDFVESADDAKEAYNLALKGKIPKKISNKDLQNFVYQTLVGDEADFDYVISDINIENRGIDIAFTFDVESGRYVPEASETAISPCKDDDYALGLEKEEKICDKPEYVAWMIPRDERITYTQYPYPQVSGILGFMEILDYSERYGIPTTNFIVKKDIAAFDILDKELVNRAKSLVKKGFFEVGSHTRYHTHLGLVDEELAEKELKESKLFLEKFFNTTVFGFRAPYFSILKDDKTHAKALEEAGYAYYSSYFQAERYFGKVPGYQIIHKPWNMKRYAAYMTPEEFKEITKEKEYIITIDHSWNMFYQDGDILVEDPEIPYNHRAIVLTAISNGGIPVMLKDLNIQ